MTDKPLRATKMKIQENCYVEKYTKKNEKCTGVKLSFEWLHFRISFMVSEVNFKHLEQLNKPYHRKVLLSDFHFSLRIHPQTLKVINSFTHFRQSMTSLNSPNTHSNWSI